MKLVFKGIVLLFSSLILIPYAVKAQEWEFGVSVGTSGYVGEFNPDNIFKFNSASGSVEAKYNFNSTWGVRGNISAIGIKVGHNLLEQYGLEPNTLYEGAVLSEFNFFKLESSKRKTFFTPYVFAGVGLARFKELEWDVNNSRHDFNTAMKATLPFGAGFKYYLNRNLALNSHLNYRIISTDNLDAMGRLGDSFMEKIASADSYMTFQIGITYTFLKQDCPTW